MTNWWTHLKQAGTNFLTLIGFGPKTKPYYEPSPFRSNSPKPTLAQEMAKQQRIADFLNATANLKELLHIKTLDRECRLAFNSSYFNSSTEVQKKIMRAVFLISKKLNPENVSKIVGLSEVSVKRWKLVYDKPGVDGGFGGVKFKLNQ